MAQTQPSPQAQDLADLKALIARMRSGERRATSRAVTELERLSKAAPRLLEAMQPHLGHALVVGFNYDRPVRGRGAGIFLHVHGRGATAGCVSVPADAMRRILRWADPGARPHIAIGTSGGATAVTRY